MAFDDDLGLTPSQPSTFDYSVSAIGLMSRTISLWSRKLVQYITIIGIFGAISGVFSFLLLFTLFDSIGVIGADPVSQYFSFFTYTVFPSDFFITVTLLFALVAFIINAIVIGATIKFALDDYGGLGASIGTSFSHSYGRMLNIIIIQLVISFLVSAATVPSLVMISRAMEVIDISDPFNPIFPPGSIELMMEAFALLLIGGIFALYILARLAPTLAIVIDSDLSVIDSLKKSWELTSGNVLHVLAGQILLSITVIVIGGVVGLFTYQLYPFDLVVASIVTTLLFGSLNFIFGVVLYRDLRSRTGTSSLEELML